MISNSSQSSSFWLAEIFVLETSTKQMRNSSYTVPALQQRAKLFVLLLVMGKTVISRSAFLTFPSLLAKHKNMLLIFLVYIRY